jgi:hypothetical protein
LYSVYLLSQDIINKNNKNKNIFDQIDKGLKKYIKKFISRIIFNNFLYFQNIK